MIVKIRLGSGIKTNRWAHVAELRVQWRNCTVHCTVTLWHIVLSQHHTHIRLTHTASSCTTKHWTLFHSPIKGDSLPQHNTHGNFSYNHTGSSPNPSHVQMHANPSAGHTVDPFPQRNTMDPVLDPNTHWTLTYLIQTTKLSLTTKNTSDPVPQPNVQWALFHSQTWTGLQQQKQTLDTHTWSSTNLKPN